MRSVGQVAVFLENYLGDLRYHLVSGIEGLNYGTACTPYFETDAEAAEYIADLETTIKILESEQ